MCKQQLIYICSPFRGDIQANIEKARGYCKSVLVAGHIPIATHLLFNGVLNDEIPIEREKALKTGLELVGYCSELWVFGDIISDGMKAEIELASLKQIPIKFNIKKIEANTVKLWVTEQLSKTRYDEFIQELIAEGDYEHPTYDEWKQEISADIEVKAAKILETGGR